MERPTEHPLLDDLNPEQRKAVAAQPESALILAGAGSGKTRVLVHRIAWLCYSEQYSPYSILAVTFTNKAAAEMRERVAQLMNVPVRGMWVGTFHSLCHRILRTHHKEANLLAAFQVIDSQDQRRLIKRVITTLGVDTEPKLAQYLINTYKEQGTRAAQVTEEDHDHALLLRVYAEYEEHCQRFGLLDFAELLLRTVELLSDNAEVLQRYQARFRYILVDEFQDTNALQYTWLKLIAGTQLPMFAVGDDDQSIYGWRGACTQNIEQFTKDFDNVSVYRLEQNYRSTDTILKAANALIENNHNRMGKKLWTQQTGGQSIHIFAAFNEREEAQFVADQAAQWAEHGRRYSECAVLYRSNAQSRVVEDILVAKNIPYQIYGGMRFFERAIIKHALAYLRIAANPNDDPSFDRIVNFPPRGLGKASLNIVRDHARSQQCSMWNSGIQCIQSGKLSPRASTSLSAFYQLIQALQEDHDHDHPLSDPAQRVARLLKAHYEGKKDEASLSCVENLDEFTIATKEFEKNFDPNELEEEDGQSESVLDVFLTRASLDAGEAQAGKGEDHLQLMTLHSAKGLEFPYVIIIGLEEYLFPHERSMGSLEELEEERRLCYVGITRAKERLTMSYAEERKRGYGGQPSTSFPSRFLNELPKELITEERRKNPYRNSATQYRNSAKQYTNSSTPAPSVAPARTNPQYNGIKIGGFVQHDSFGEGVVLKFEGTGSNQRALVRFECAGEKWLILQYANLKALQTG